MIGKLTLLAASLLFVFGVFEFYLRITGYAHAGKRSGNVVYHRVDEFQHTAVLNSLELRGAEIGAKVAGEYRILALGDSFTYGLGVEEEETFVRRTEDLLRERVKRDGGPTRVRVVNCGVGGGPYSQSEWLSEVGMLLEPDLVVLAFFIGNDLYDDQHWRGTGEKRNEYRAAARKLRVVDWLYSRLISIPFADRMLFEMGYRYHRRGMFLTDQRGLETQAWELTLSKILGMWSALREQGASFLVMIIPASEQVRFGDDRPEGEDYRLPNRKLVAFLGEHHIPRLDLLPLMEGAEDRDGFYYRRDLHWTAEGHRFASEKLARTLWEKIQKQQTAPRS